MNQAKQIGVDMFDIYKIHPAYPKKTDEEIQSAKGLVRSLTSLIRGTEQDLIDGPRRTYLIVSQQQAFCDLPSKALQQIRFKSLWRTAQDIDDLRQLIKSSYSIKCAVWHLENEGYYFHIDHTWESFQSVGLPDQPRNAG